MDGDLQLARITQLQLELDAAKKPVVSAAGSDADLVPLAVPTTVES
jgi:hypothetical protein